MIGKTSTPVRREIEYSTPRARVTSPYFSDANRDFSTRKRESHATTERQSMVDLAEGIDHKTSVTSPYFASARTLSRRYNMDSDGEAEIERVETQRKRRRLNVRGVTPDGPGPPPSSPDELSQALRLIKPSLIQERICDDPWKIIVATTLLNKTNGKAAVPIFWELIKRWPTPIALAQGLYSYVKQDPHHPPYKTVAAAPSLTDLLRSLGTQSMRTSRLIRLSNAYVMHPPVLPLQQRHASGGRAECDTPPMLLTDIKCTVQCSPASSFKRLGGNNAIPTADESSTMRSPRISTKEYRAVQRTSPIAHLPFTGPYAIDSFRIFSLALNGGGAGARVEEKLGRVARLAESNQYSRNQDDFDETPGWYNPRYLRVTDDDDAEWRKVRPEDKQLRRYLVWRWAIEGVEYDPETHTHRSADWSYLVRLIRQ
ncbi:unnamed protein product [Rhizoctonia solani]|uniref:HhH-GPD domain-containing protein n=1 Tax=Rhizoctonia solani TaxID=456999 RepID=A0A8H3AXQ7_9AGAM|nr:unnamed protein product [Rhizoctonia solani]